MTNATHINVTTNLGQLQTDWATLIATLNAPSSTDSTKGDKANLLTDLNNLWNEFYGQVNTMIRTRHLASP